LAVISASDDGHVVISIRTIRRQEILQAAFHTLQKRGMTATTIESVAKKLKAPKSLIHYHFQNKQELIVLTLRYAHALRQRSIVEKLKTARSPSERIWAIVSVNLSPAYVNPDWSNVWISFTAKSLDEQELAILQKVIRRRERSNLLHALRLITSEHVAVDSVQAIMALVEACRLWTGYISGYSSENAVSMVKDYLLNNVPGFDPAAVNCVDQQ
jgi:AcrR family transcriptional regulator